MKLLKSVDGFTKVGLRRLVASDFVKALTNTFMFFSFACVNIRQPSLRYPQIRAFQPIAMLSK